MKKSLTGTLLLSTCQLCLADLQSIDDNSLDNITGQAGLSIELTTQMTIDEIKYTDEGSILINDISVTGANKASYFGKAWGGSTQSGNTIDGIKLRVDVLSDGDLVLNADIDTGLVDFAVSTGTIQLQNAAGDQTNTLIDSLNITGLAKGFLTKIDSETRHIYTETKLGFDDIDIEISSLKIGVEDMVIAGSGYFERIADFGPGGLDIDQITTPMIFDIYANDTGLVVDLLQMEMDIAVGAVRIGDSSIGSFQLDDLNITGTSMTISGHP